VTGVVCIYNIIRISVCVYVYVHVLCGVRGGGGDAEVVVIMSAVYMCMDIYVAADLCNMHDSCSSVRKGRQ